MLPTTENWLVGETARLTLDLVDAAGIAIDPVTITLKIKPPAGPLQTISAPAATATGRYRHDLALATPGRWYYRWETTAPLPAAVEGSLTVQPSRFSL